MINGFLCKSRLSPIREAAVQTRVKMCEHLKTYQTEVFVTLTGQSVKHMFSQPDDVFMVFVITSWNYYKVM